MRVRVCVRVHLYSSGNMQINFLSRYTQLLGVSKMGPRKLLLRAIRWLGGEDEEEVGAGACAHSCCRYDVITRNNASEYIIGNYTQQCVIRIYYCTLNFKFY